MNRIRRLKRQKSRMMRLVERMCELPEYGTDRPLSARAHRLAQLFADTERDLQDTAMLCNLSTIIGAGFKIDVRAIEP